MKVVLTGTSIVLALVIIFVNIANYALYSTKRNLIARGIDHSVCAAIQEIDIPASTEGLAEGYDTETGILLSEDIRLNEVHAENTFWATLEANTGIDRTSLIQNTMIVFLSPVNAGINYAIKKDTDRVEGFVSSPENLEPVINSAIQNFWGNNEENSDSHTIYVNGNPSTNAFTKTPHFLVFIKNQEIDGLFRKRTATFVGFAGAKLERRK